MEVLYQNLLAIKPNQVIMWLIGGVLICLAIVKEMEPALLLPMGFGAILVNLPNSGAASAIEHLFQIGIGANVSGQIASVIAGSLILALVRDMIGG